MAQAEIQVNAEFPEKLKFLFEPSRYKVAYGGRGGTKSWGFARALLIKGVQQPLRVLCARELQKSIKDSVHQLLEDQIKFLGLGAHYQVLQSEIRGPNGTVFGFQGLRHNVTDIKSWEGADVCWVEEAQKVSKSSWNVLVPTIRKAGSEIWVSFNPEYEEDETYQRFIVGKPSGAVVEKVSWRDNPWLTPELRAEMEDTKARNIDDYLHVWEGECITVLDGAIFADELRAAKIEGRIGDVPYERGRSIEVIFDLGFSDQTAIWLVQNVAFQYRFIGYYENNRKPIEHYLQWLQAQSLVYNKIWLPHDGFSQRLGQSQGTIAKQISDAGWQGRVKRVPRLSKKNQLNAARRVFPNAWFDRENCKQGLKALHQYQYDIDPTTKTMSKNPLHNWASNGADAFLYSALVVRPAEDIPDEEAVEESSAIARALTRAKQMKNFGGSLGWMR